MRIKNEHKPGTSGFIPLILATQEADVRRTAVRSQHKQLVRPYFESINTKKGWQSGSSAGMPA
jgi:hypothetical protein